MAQRKSITSLPPDARVAWVAARQHGVIAHDQLARVGLFLADGFGLGV
jgi:hypothetical protein